jgi:hypothetical protein
LAVFWSNWRGEYRLVLLPAQPETSRQAPPPFKVMIIWNVVAVTF